jgi:uncharacterized small protein (DUF1192 family)
VLKAVRPPLCLDPTPEVAKQAYIINYNKLKWNIGCRALGRYRTPKGALRDRQLRIAAALKAQKLAEGLVKRSKLSLNHLGSEKAIPELAIPPPSLGESFPAGHDAAATSLSPGMIKSRLSAQAAPGLIPLMQANSSQGSPGHQMAVPHPGGLTHSLLALSIPSVPLSPSSSTPATPATPSTVTSASGHEVTSSLSMLGRRESKESAAMARAETKRLKAEQAKLEKLQQHERKQDAKELKEKQRKEKVQQQHQLKMDKQQMSQCNSHVPLVSQQSGSLLQGDGMHQLLQENISGHPLGDPMEVADAKPKIEQQDNSVLLDHPQTKGMVSRVASASSFLLALGE